MLARALRTIAIALVAAGCSAEAPSPDQAAAPASQAAPPAAPASFVNKVWSIAESEQVAPGALRVFLSDGTLVMASTTGTPAFGTWRYADSRLTITEEGLEYAVDILELTPETFRIRMNGPGDPVVIRFAPAASPPLSGGSLSPAGT